MDAGPLAGILAVFVLVATNGFFVAAEFGLVKVRLTRIDELVDEGKRVAKVVQDELRHLDNHIAATQLGITLASLALGWIGEPSLAHLIEPLIAFTGGTAATELAHSAAIAVSFFLITMFHIVLGELVPKSIALQRSEGTTFFVARPLYLFARLFRPFIIFMNGLGNLVVRAFGLQTASEHGSVHTVKELEMLVAQSHKAGLLVVETTDVIFALDSIPAIFAVTQNPFLVNTSNVFAILGLRSLYFVFANAMGRFSYLKLGLAVVLSFVGVKMVLADSFHIPTALSLGVIALILTVATVASMLRTRRLATRKGEPEAQASDTSTRELMPRR